MAFTEMNIHDLSFNPFDKINNQWMLITAGDEQASNTMTASWGGLGIMWNKNVATIYVRPQRHTKKFLDANEKLTLSFLSDDLKAEKTKAGRITGAEVADKWAAIGLTPAIIDGVAAVEEAEMVFVCKKLYAQDMKPECFTVGELDEKNYPNKDYHMMYIVEIEKVVVK
ncbi:MAG: flavin reductase [Dorea sp.]|nr:flavin reductase [Dorea sp.]